MSMKSRRHELHDKLKTVCNTVYFQPPRSESMKYPCIRYELAGIPTARADNKVYLNWKRYTVTYITENPDDEVVAQLLELLPHVSFDRQYKSGNLYHNVFEIYY